MIEKGSVGGSRKGPDADGKTPMRGKKGEPRKYECAAPVLNFPAHHNNVRSTRRPEIVMAADAARQLFAAGMLEISETFLSEHIPFSGRRYRGTALKAMRLLATRYPNDAALILREGGWILVPAGVSI